jgi:hypothetical protein
MMTLQTLVRHALRIRARDLLQTYRKMHLRVEFPAPEKEPEFGRECGCLATAPRGHRVLHRQ